MGKNQPWTVTDEATVDHPPPTSLEAQMSAMMHNPWFYVALLVVLVLAMVIPLVAVRVLASRNSHATLPPKPIGPLDPNERPSAAPGEGDGPLSRRQRRDSNRPYGLD